jgi:hypothetical protein
VITIRQDPSPREIRVFGGLWLAFFVGVGGIAWWRPEGLVGAAIFLTAAWLVSLVLNRENRRGQLLGAAIPALFATAGGAASRGVPPLVVLLAAVTIGLAGALAIWAAPQLGRRLYHGWMLAALPIGWTISHLVLAVVFYGVLTPIALVLRLAGRDPLERRFDRAAATYWVERPAEQDPKRAFRQF